MKSVLISVRPKFAKLEMNGKKLIKIRKNYIEPPFKVFNYVTKGGNDSLVFSTDYEDVAWNRPYIDKEHNRVWTTLHGNYLKKLCKDKIWNGKVAFEYVVNKVDTYRYEYDYETEEGYYDIDDDMLEECYLTLDEIIEYGNRKNILLYHISDLKIYDKPKELSEFFTPMGKRPSYMLERPPQSWCYVEVER